jgi:hypothetical protein
MHRSNADGGVFPVKKKHLKLYVPTHFSINLVKHEFFKLRTNLNSNYENRASIKEPT